MNVREKMEKSELVLGEGVKVLFEVGKRKSGLPFLFENLL